MTVQWQAASLKADICKNKEPSSSSFSIFQKSQNLICASGGKKNNKLLSFVLLLLFDIFTVLFLSAPNYLCQDPFSCLKYLQVYRFFSQRKRRCTSGLTCRPSLSQKRESTLTERVHELVASL